MSLGLGSAFVADALQHWVSVADVDGFNLSRWGLRHPQLLAFLIVLIALAGGLAYLKLGRAEDPSFTIKNAAISGIWPGATSEEMQGQVADPIERKLQETKGLDEALAAFVAEATPPDLARG